MSVIVFVAHCIYTQTAQPITVQSGFRSFWLFSIACTNSEDRIIHGAMRMNLGVTPPQAVYQPPSSCRVPKNFPSMQLGSEILRQLTASFSCCFFVLSLSFSAVFKSSNHLVLPLIHFSLLFQIFMCLSCCRKNCFFFSSFVFEITASS